MMVAMTDKEYQSKISLAEAAVAQMSDPKLREVAFAKILEQLLRPVAEYVAVRGARRTGSSSVSRHPSRAVGGGPISLIETLIDEQFFEQPRALRDVQAELVNRGHRIPRTSLSGPLQAL